MALWVGVCVWVGVGEGSEGGGYNNEIKYIRNPHNKEKEGENGWGDTMEEAFIHCFYLIPCYYIRSIKTPLMHTSI